MMDAVTKTNEERIEELEAKVAKLAKVVQRQLDRKEELVGFCESLQRVLNQHAACINRQTFAPPRRHEGELVSTRLFREVTFGLFDD